MPINKKDIQHIAHLSRIELTPEEEEKFAEDLGAILGFIEELNQVNTEGVEPMTGGTTLENIMRPDEQVDTSLEAKEAQLLEAVPEKKDGYVKVKAVFE